MKHLLKIAFVILLVALNLNVSAQGISSDFSYEVTCLKDTLDLNPGQFGFNSITLTNNTRTELSFGVRVELPVGWSLLRDVPAVTTVQAGFSSTIPLRIKSSQFAIGGTDYPIRIIFTDPISGSRKVKIFHVKTVSNSHWVANLTQSTKFSSDYEELPDFNFRIKNVGNKTELFQITFESELRLTYPSTGFQLILKPGVDTLINVGIRSRSLNQVSGQIKIIIESKETKKVLLQNLFIVTDNYQENESDKYVMPINVKWTGFNLLNPNNFLQMFETDGYLKLEKNRTLSFRYRTYIQGLYNRTSFDIQQFGYYFRKGELTIGNTQDYYGKMLQGNGFKLNLRGNKKTVELMAIQTLGIKDLVIGARTQNFFKNESSLSSEILWEKKTVVDHKNAYGIVNYEKNLKEKGDFNIKGGYSLESSKNYKEGAIQNGLMGGYSLNYTNKKFNLISAANYSNPWYVGNTRGVLNGTTSFTYNMAKIRAGVFGNYVSRTFYNYTPDYSDATERFVMKNQDYGFRIGTKFTHSSIFFEGSKIEQLQNAVDAPKASTDKFSVKYNFYNSKISQYVNVSMLNSKYRIESTTEKYTAFSAAFTGRYKGFGYVSRFERGPVYYFDFLYQQVTGRTPVRHQHNAYYESSKKESNWRTRYSLNYFAMGNSIKPSFFAQSNVFVTMPRYGLSLNAFVGVNMLDVKSSPNFNLTVIKNFNLKLPFFKKYNDLKVTMYKDANNNNNWDSGEEPVKEANVLVNDRYMRTDESGKITLDNVSKRDYKVNFSNVTNQLGWIPAKIETDPISLKNSQEVVIPFKKSKVVTGQIFVKRDEHSARQEPRLDGIQLIATNERGETFKAITNIYGKYFFNLNESVYTIRVLENIYSDGFILDKGSVKVDLFNSQEEQIDFTLIEKVRKINIRKSSQGKE